MTSVATQNPFDLLFVDEDEEVQKIAHVLPPKNVTKPVAQKKVTTKPLEPSTVTDLRHPKDSRGYISCYSLLIL